MTAAGVPAEQVAWLFCPADRPERFAKAANAADVVILDLEDGVAAAHRPAARAALAEADLDPARTIVRLNPVGTADHPLDRAVLAQTPFRRVMLAKTETIAALDTMAGLRVTALCETPRGVLAAPVLAEHPAVEALMWGSEDLVAALGGQSSRLADGTYREIARHARASVLLAAGAAERAAVDSVYIDISDLDGLAVEAQDACASGFAAKACIHPSQVAVVRAAYEPSAEQREWAERVLVAAEGARGVFSVDGRMVDEPLLRQARATLARGQ